MYVNKRSFAIILGLTAVLIWSTVATAFKITLRHMDPVTMVYFSSFVSLITIAIYLIIKGEFRRIMGMSRKNRLLSVSIGLINPFVYYLVLFGSYDRLPAQVAQSINYSWPVILTILSIFILKQKINSRSIIGISIAFFGIIIVSTRGFSLLGGMPDMIGLILAMGSALIWAFFWTFNLKIKGKTAPKLFLNFLGGMIPLSIVFALSGPELPRMEGLLAVSYVGMFEMGLTFILWLTALSLVKDTSRISSLIYLGPFISLVLIAIVLREPILVSTLIGLTLIVAGLVVQRSKRNNGSGRKVQ